MLLPKFSWLLCCLPKQYTPWHFILENPPLTFRQIAKYVWFFLYQSIPKRSQRTYFEKVIDVCVFDLLLDLLVHVLSILGGFTQGHVILLYVDDIYLMLESTLRTFSSNSLGSDKELAAYRQDLWRLQMLLITSLVFNYHTLHYRKILPFIVGFSKVITL